MTDFEWPINNINVIVIIVLMFPFVIFRYQIPLGFDLETQVICETSYTSTLMENSRELRHTLSRNASVLGEAFGVEFSASIGFKKETETFTST